MVYSEMQADDWKNQALKILQQVVEDGESLGVFAVLDIMEGAQLRSLKEYWKC